MCKNSCLELVSERRVSLAKREVVLGVVLKVSIMGGYSGWIHACIRRPGTSGDLLGRFTREAAVKAIAAVWSTAGCALT
nr:hypothetical protein Ade03nite_62970 [Actinoplanes derwentensis]